MARRSRLRPVCRAVVGALLLAGCAGGALTSGPPDPIPTSVTSPSATSTTPRISVTTTTPPPIRTTGPLGSLGSESGRGGVGLPEPGFFYHGVYPGGVTGWEDDITPADVDAYEHAVGRSVAWVYFSDNWFNGREFPETTVDWIEQRGAVPFIRLMLRSDTDEIDGPDPSFPLERIVAGDFDDDLERWGSDAAEHGPLIVEWGTEMNGEWFSWNGVWNGGGQVGPPLFRAAYRHIIERVGEGGADITWVFHINADDDPDADGNRFERYYPGDDVIDWLGVSAYGALTPLDDYWISLAEQLDQAVPRLKALAPDKPVFLLEFGVTAGNPNGDPPAWADEALTQILAGRWPELRGFSWWNETWENDDDPDHDTDMRVQTVPGLADVFRSHLASNPRVLDRPLFG